MIFKISTENKTPQLGHACPKKNGNISLLFFLFFPLTQKKVGTSSVVSYTPMTELDYGTLLCVATNRIGKQRQACVFHIIAAGRFHKAFFGLVFYGVDGSDEIFTILLEHTVTIHSYRREDAPREKMFEFSVKFGCF